MVHPIEWSVTSAVAIVGGFLALAAPDDRLRIYWQRPNLPLFCAFRRRRARERYECLLRA